MYSDSPNSVLLRNEHVLEVCYYKEAQKMLSATEYEATIDFSLIPLLHWSDFCCNPAIGPFSGPRTLHHNPAQWLRLCSCRHDLTLRVSPRTSLSSCATYFNHPQKFYLSLFHSLFLFLYAFFLCCDHKRVRNNGLGFHKIPELWTEKTWIVPHYQESSFN